VSLLSLVIKWMLVHFTEWSNGCRFYNIIYDQDCQYFTGITLFKHLTESYIFSLPSEEQIMAGIPALDGHQDIPNNGPNDGNNMEM
jgi:hypothetical protein